MHSKIGKFQLWLHLGPVGSLGLRRLVFLVNVVRFWAWPAPRPCKPGLLNCKTCDSARDCRTFQLFALSSFAILPALHALQRCKLRGPKRRFRMGGVRISGLISSTDPFNLTDQVQLPVLISSTSWISTATDKPSIY